MTDSPITNGNILVVDDVPANLRLLSQMLIEQGYRVRAVTSGTRALVSAETETPDLVLLDIRMPEMNGFEVCRQLKGNPRTQHVPVIFISALGDVQDKIQAFQAGGVDYLTKPFQVEEVIARVEIHLALLRLQQQLQEANRKLARELALAGKIQASFLPDRLPQPPGWQLSAELRPARETSGDFYDAFQLPDGRLALFIADVVDKGAGAALYMALCLSLLRSTIHECPDRPEEVLALVNSHLLHDVHTEQFVTVFLAVLDPQQGELVYSNAGQNPPLLVSPEGQIERLITTGIPLGIAPRRTWQQKSVTFPSDGVLVMYTDGITEAESKSGTLYEMAGLETVLLTHFSQPSEVIRKAIVADVARFTTGQPQMDDIALMVIVHRQ